MSLSKFSALKLSFSRYCTVRVPLAAFPRKVSKVRQRVSEGFLVEYLNNNEKIDVDKWGKIREELLAADESLTPINIDAVILDTCCNNDNHDAALNYIDYLRSNNFKLNVATIGKYMNILSKKDEKLTETEQNDIIEMYDNLRRDYEILDPMTAEYCIRGITRTRKWKDAFELKKMLGDPKPSLTVFSFIICAAFDNNEAEIGWQLMKELVSLKGYLEKRAYISYLNYAWRIGKNEREIERYIDKFLSFLGHWDLYPWISVMEEYSRAMGEFGWRGTATKIKMNGICRNCGDSLSQLNLTDKEFEYLSNTFMERALIGPDVYNKTTPMELVNFKAFIESAKPYDIVIDGLNVEYTLSKNKHGTVTGTKLATVVKFLVEQNKKVVVLGRKHMLRWQRDPMNYIKRNAEMFVANDISEDDPYLLYATLAGGPDTYFVSRDLMRQHLFLLNDPEIQRIFKLWQSARQITPELQGSHKKNQTVFLAYPPSYAPIAQKNKNTWHLPCIDDTVVRQPQLYNLALPWYCLKKKIISKTNIERIDVSKIMKTTRTSNIT